MVCDMPLGHGMFSMVKDLLPCIVGVVVPRQDGQPISHLPAKESQGRVELGDRVRVPVGQDGLVEGINVEGTRGAAIVRDDPLDLFHCHCNYCGEMPQRRACGGPTKFSGSFEVSEDVNSEALAISSGTPNVENINLRWDMRPLDPVQSCSARNMTGQWE